MSVIDTIRTRILPVSGAERQAVRDELTHVLRSRHFTSSKRYPALLTYVVEETLAGRSAELKERTLGIEVFNRPLDYDTISDTVVRVTAGEVRKRLALVYHESEDEHEIQITLPAGSYVPEFLRLAQDEQTATVGVRQPDEYLSASVEAEPLPSSLLPPVSTQVAAPANSRRRYVFVAAVAVAVVALGSWVYATRAQRMGSVEQFWQPIFASNTPAILCPGTLVRSTEPPYGMIMATRKDDYPYTSMSTTMAIVRLISWIDDSHKSYLVQPTSGTTLADMREHPIILLGAYNNEWTPRLEDELPYRFAPEPLRQIVDAANPSQVWMRPPTLPIRDEDDYAVVARFHSKLTGNIVMLIAGIGKNGTEAATQFVTMPQYMDLLRQQSKDWAEKNVELVLKVKVINGKNGALSVEAVHVW